MVIEIPHNDFIYNISPGLAIMRPNTDLIHFKTEKINRLISTPTNADTLADKSPPISRDELLYILDSLNDLDNGSYYSSRPNQTVEEFIDELRR